MQIKKNTTILFLTFIIFLSFSLFIPQVYGADSNPHGYAVKYVTSFNGMVSGVPFQFVDKIVIDESAGEIYLLDAGNWRIVAVDTTGIYLYEFNYKNEGVERPITFDVDFKNGDMYLVEANKVTVLNYRGKFKRNFEIPHEEELNKFYINSIDVVETPKGTKIYRKSVV